MRPRLAALGILIAAGVAAGGVSAQGPDLASRLGALYSQPPDLAKCRSGTLAPGEKRKALDTLNDIRRLHGLAPVTYDPEGDEEVMQASLMFAVNASLDHDPPPSWKCYTAAGARGAGASNLHGGRSTLNYPLASSESIVIGWVTDAANAVPDSVGHRRWLLNPFLEKIAFGRVAGQLDGAWISEGAAIKVIYGASERAGGAAGDMIAYPYHDYPARYYDPRAILSFAAIVDPASRWANRAVDYSAAKVELRKRGGAALPIRNLRWDNRGFGLPNNLQFAAGPLEYGAVYDVSVKGVRAGGTSRDFSYWFRIVP